MNTQPKNFKIKSIITITIAIILLLLLIFSEDIVKLQNKNKVGLLENTAQAGYTTTIGDKTYDITNVIAENANSPTMSAGMIPVKWEGTYWTITSKYDTSWYDYNSEKPAFIMLNDGTYQSELLQDMTNKKLAEENIGVQIAKNELGSIYMWLPRYAYNENGEILNIKQGCSVAGSWTMPEIFVYETDKTDFSLAGVWVEYNPLSSTNEVTTKINNMTGEDNKYGFIANTQSIAMTKTDLPAIEKYIAGVGVHNDLIIDTSNLNRTILKITNTNQQEPIKAKAYYDNEEEKIKIEVTYSKNSITKILDKKGKILSENSTIADTGDEVIGNKIYKYIIIDDQYNSKEILVAVTGLEVYIIENQEDLKYFRDEVNNGSTTVNTKVYQIADVKMNEGKYKIDEETGEITFAEDAEQWIPIGTNNYKYKGKYFGNDYMISGIYINSNENNMGLFGYYNGTLIDSLNIKNSKIKGGEAVGGLIGYTDINSTITKCSVSANIEGTGKVGGFAGWSTNTITIEECLNRGMIKSEGSYVGGFVGLNSSTTNIKHSSNSGIIKSGSYSVGGLAGQVKNVFIEYCSNEGEVIGTSSIGGVVGVNINANSGYIRYCYNTGNITGNKTIGGVAGYFSKNIDFCYNNGTILGETGSVGGIVGEVYSSVEKCYNTGNISTTSGRARRHYWRKSL